MQSLSKIGLSIFVLCLFSNKGIAQVDNTLFKDTMSLKKIFEEKFYIGVAINRNQANGNDKKAQPVIGSQFNSISPENDLKWEKIHPYRNVYDFANADTYVNFGVKNNMFTIGHTLVWHSQTPDWVFEDENGKQLSRDALLKVMKEHITTVVTRYKGRIKGWDVVNEAFNEDGSLRQSKWLTIIGEDYIEKAFEYAHIADPEAELYYNEYNLYKPEKRAGVLKLLGKLKAKNSNITAIGEQAHYNLNNPAIGDVEKLIIDFRNLGLEVNFTELDINVLPDKDENLTADVSNKEVYNIKYNPYTSGLPVEVKSNLAMRYSTLFKLFKKYSSNISRITFWGLTDADSWLNNWPMPGRTNYPLLYDREYKLKTEVFQAIKNDL
jgi:endo-1,4-beta-xylanase